MKFEWNSVIIYTCDKLPNGNNKNETDNNYTRINHGGASSTKSDIY